MSNTGHSVNQFLDLEAQVDNTSDEKSEDGLRAFSIMADSRRVGGSGEERRGRGKLAVHKSRDFFNKSSFSNHSMVPDINSIVVQSSGLKSIAAVGRQPLIY